MFDAEGRTLELVPRLPTLSWCAKVPYLAKFLAMESCLPIRQASKRGIIDRKVRCEGHRTCESV